MEEITNTNTNTEGTVNTGIANDDGQAAVNTDNQTAGSSENTNVNETTDGTANQTVDGNTQKSDFFDGSKMAKAFSARLNKEKEKLSSQLSEQYSNQYKPYEQVLDIAAKNFNMSREDYIKSILDQYSEENGQATNDKNNTAQKNPPPNDEKESLLNELLQEKQEKKIADAWNNQVQALLKIDSNITEKDIPDEMLIESQEKNIPLQYLYAFKMLTADRENFEKSIKEKTIADLQKINKTAGSMSSGQTDTQPSKISDMSDKDFHSLLEKVKRGEVKSLS